MGTHAERARELFEQGYNCAQAVFAAFCDETGLDMEMALKIAAPFGGGMARLREVCGAVTGMFLVAGIQYGYTDPDGKEEKTQHYRMVQELAKKFEAEKGSIICRELLGLDCKSQPPVPSDRTEQYYHQRPCGALVAYAAQLMEDYMARQEQG